MILIRLGIIPPEEWEHIINEEKIYNKSSK